MGADDTFTIDELADAAGMTPRNVRAYRTKGLLPPPIREGRASSYRATHLQRLKHIRELRDAGLPLKLIMEAARRGDDLSPRGPLSLLTTTVTTGPEADGDGIGEPDGAVHVIDLIRAEDESDAPEVRPGSPEAHLVAKLAAHGVTQATILVILLRTARAGRTLSGEITGLLCGDLLTAQPAELPPALVDDAAELTVVLTRQAFSGITAIAAITAVSENADGATNQQHP
jgi:DNA-binding transcriptional MerR regulator